MEHQWDQRTFAALIDVLAAAVTQALDAEEQERFVQIVEGLPPKTLQAMLAPDSKEDFPSDFEEEFELLRRIWINTVRAYQGIELPPRH